MTAETRASTDTRLLPVSAYQEMMVYIALDAQSTDAYHNRHTPALALRITPCVSLRTLKHAFAKLVKRHDSLRLRFVQDGEEWKAEILPEHPTGPIIEDAGDLPEEAQIARILDLVRHPITALSHSLFQMRVIRCGRFGDIVLIQAHHSIIDGYGFALMIEDLLKFLLNLPVITPAVTHEEFITRQLQEIEKNRKATEAFWRDRLLPPPPEPNIGRIAHGMPRPSHRSESPTNCLDSILNAEQSRQLDAMVRDTGLSGFSYLYAALAETLCDISGQDDILIHSILGRQDAHLANFIGCEVQEIILPFTRGTGNIKDSARCVQENVADALRHTPTDLFYRTESWVAKELYKLPGPSRRFLVHNRVPTGRIEASPFRKLLSAATDKKVSMGFVTLERIDLPRDRDANELFLSVNKTDDRPNAKLFAQQDAFTPAELDAIVAGMKDRLEV